MDEKTAEALDQALEESFREVLQERARKAIEKISRHVSQRKLELLLGLSQGYLSKLRSGDRVPSAELVSQLALISRDPGNRISELESYWDEE
jgi:transcriptional regulator with XRE-family HTH domain